jgi:membrane fusion protein (multidrug efflux system)
MLFKRGTVSTDDAYTAGNIVRVTPLVSGTVVEAAADATQRVAEGEVLLRLDTSDARLALASAWEDLYSQALNVGSMLAERERLSANLRAAETAVALAQSDYDRRRKLSPGTSVTREELERHRLLALQAGAALEAARAELAANASLLGPGPPEEHPSVMLAAARVERAWLDLARCEIRSPVAGTVARRAAQPGALATPQQPVMTVVQDGRVWVDANFKESQLARIRPGLPARVTVDMLGGRAVYRGVVEGVGAGTGSVFSLLPAENATGNWIKVVQRVPVRITLDEGDLAASPLILGLSCRVVVDLEGAPASAPPRRGRRTDLALAPGPDMSDVRGRIASEVARRLARNGGGGPLPGPGAASGLPGPGAESGQADPEGGPGDAQ